MEIISWILQHAQSALESAGIIGGLVVTAISLRTETRARRVANLLTITEQYRSIWEALYDRPHLSHVLDPKRDVKLHPPTEEEKLFVRFLIVHLGTVYRAFQADELLEPQGTDRDVKDFFALPAPKVIWQDLKGYQDRDFVKWVDAIIDKSETQK